MRRALMAVVVLAACGTKVVDLGESDARDPVVPDTRMWCATKAMTDYERCLVCGLEQRACLKCQSAASPGNCRLCTWTDGVGGECKQCLDMSGKVTIDDCDRLRPELPPRD